MWNPFSHSQQLWKLSRNMLRSRSSVRSVLLKIIQPAMMEDAFEDEDEIPVEKDAPQQAVLHKKLLEETQQLRVQMDEYEDELTDLSDGVEKTNKLLNFVLCFLILVLLVIIGFIAYSLWKAGGI